MFWVHFRQSQNSSILPISELNQYIDCQSRTKIASTFDEVSIESSEFRAFDRHIIGGASYVSSRTIIILAKVLLPRSTNLPKFQTCGPPESTFRAKSGMSPPPKSRLRNTFSRDSRNFWAAKWAATRVHFSSHRFDI